MTGDGGKRSLLDSFVEIMFTEESVFDLMILSLSWVMAFGCDNYLVGTGIVPAVMLQLVRKRVEFEAANSTNL